jgi:pimeloyl-ACP methyl ester carboxylesterase
VSGLYPFDSHYIEVGDRKARGDSSAGGGGHRMHYVDEGQGDPVLMVHGNPSWSFFYRDLIKELQSSHRVIAPDHIGCGRSDKPNDDQYDYTLSSRVTDLGTLADSLDLRDITLVVHDWGGMIGMAWASQHADRIARLVIMNTAAFPLHASKRLPTSLALARTPGIGALLVRGANAFSRGAVRYCVTRRPMSKAVAAGYLKPYDSWAHRIAVHRFVQDIPLQENDRAYPIMKETGEALSRLADKPMLICWGLRDFVFDHHFLEEWIRRFPDADVRRFEDCGHYVLEDAGEEIAPLVREFVESHIGSRKKEPTVSPPDQPPETRLSPTDR